MLVFEERGKPEYLEKNLSKQSREQTNSAHMTPSPGIEPWTHWWKASALTAAPTLLPRFESHGSYAGCCESLNPQ